MGIDFVFYKRYIVDHTRVFLFVINPKTRSSKGVKRLGCPLTTLPERQYDSMCRIQQMARMYAHTYVTIHI